MANDGGFSGVEAPLGCLLLPAGSKRRPQGLLGLLWPPESRISSAPGPQLAIWTSDCDSDFSEVEALAGRGGGAWAQTPPFLPRPPRNRRGLRHLERGPNGRRERRHLCCRPGLGSPFSACPLRATALRSMQRRGLGRARPPELGARLPDSLRSLRFRPASALRGSACLK
jgi:hypothetical protein